jgi:hypothetical protein
MKKTNPRKKPATGADVKKAWQQGVKDGVQNATAIILTVLVDHFGMAEQIPDVWKAVCKLSEEVGDNMVSLADLRHVLLTEYKIEV